MRQAFFIHLFAFLLANTSVSAKAFSDYDVDWPKSGNGKHSLRIVVDGCVTLFTIEDKNLEAFKNKIHDDDEERSKIVKVAIKRAQNGCK